MYTMRMVGISAERLRLWLAIWLHMDTMRAAGEASWSAI